MVCWLIFDIMLNPFIHSVQHCSRNATSPIRITSGSARNRPTNSGANSANTTVAQTRIAVSTRTPNQNPRRTRANRPAP